MRKIEREDISPKVVKWFEKWTEVIRQNGATPDAARTRWSGARRTEKVQLAYDTLVRMNGCLGERCVFCEHDRAYEIDHFIPISLAPLQTFDWDNHFLSCSGCNSRNKRSRYSSGSGPLTSTVSAEFIDFVPNGRSTYSIPAGTLPVNPCEEDPRSHLRPLISGEMAMYTPEGVWTVELFGLDDRRLIEQRKQVWDIQPRWISDYASHRQQGDGYRALEYARKIVKSPCRSVLREVVEMAQGDQAIAFGLEGVKDAINDWPEIAYFPLI